MELKNIILCAAAAIGVASCAKPDCIERTDDYGKYIGYECEVVQDEALPLLSYGHVSLPGKETCYARSTSSHHQETYMDYGCDNIVDKFYNVNSFVSSGEPDVGSVSREPADNFFTDTLNPNYLIIKDKVLNRIDKEKYR